MLKRFRSHEGEVRLQSGPSLTEYTFTGQYSYTGSFGLMFYNARWYDPALGRFAQADSIVPPGVHPQFMGAGGLDRYAYVNNSPMNYVDPSGHVTCEGVNWDDGPKCTSKPEFWRKTIKNEFDWNIASDFSLEELQIIYQTGQDIVAYVNGLTGGRGQDWILEYLGGITITHDYTLPNNQSYPAGTPLASVPDGGVTFLNGKWTDKTNNGGWDPHQLFAHELAHHLDCASSGYVGPGCVGGAGDMLADFIGAEPGIVRFDLSGKLSFLSDPYIPANYRWSQSVHQGYGNNSTGEYFAESFSWNIYGQEKLPQSLVGAWLDVVISLQASNLP
ncbi:MAG: hypothetical protein HS100_18825 [Anaerolineales bacterium]|nr:hypothetical protein [Anaerolineales bacterium]